MTIFAVALLLFFWPLFQYCIFGKVETSPPKKKYAFLLPVPLSLLSLILSPWEFFPLLALCILLITWPALAIRGVSQKKRHLLLFFAGGSLLHPCFVPLFLFLAVHEARYWDHHAQMTLRASLTLFAATLVTPLADVKEVSSIALLLCIGTHYALPGIRKMTLGKRPWSWALKNELHHLPRAAYAWGWLRILPYKSWVKATRPLKTFAPIIQTTIVLFELSFFALLYSNELTHILLFAALVFHLLYFAMTGALFWQNICLLSALLFLLPPIPETQPTFLFGIAAIALNIWRVQKLGWWDTPFTNRVEIVAVTASGERMYLPPNYFSPHERMFAACKRGLHLSKEKLLTKHLGEISSQQIAREICAAQNDLRKLPLLVDTWGVAYFSEEAKNEVIAFIQKALQKPKVPFAPPESWYFWNKLRTFTGKEEIVEVELFFVREYAAEKKVKELYRRPLWKVPISR